jgi:hypothetical protein
VENFGALRKRYGDRHLKVGCCRQLKIVWVTGHGRKVNPFKIKDETAHRVRTRGVGALTTLGSFACTEQKRMMMVINLDRLAHCVWTVRDKWP